MSKGSRSRGCRLPLLLYSVIRLLPPSYEKEGRRMEGSRGKQLVIMREAKSAAVSVFVSRRG